MLVRYGCLCLISNFSFNSLICEFRREVLVSNLWESGHKATDETLSVYVSPNTSYMQILLNPLSCSPDKNPVTVAKAGEAALSDIMDVAKIVLNLILKSYHALSYMT